MKRAPSHLTGGVWVTGSRLLAQLIQFGIFIVAAQVLRPEDFGVFALVAAVIVFLNLVATAGWSEYVMHWQGDSDRLRYTLFVAFVMGAVIALVGIVMSFPMAKFFAEPDAGPLARVLSVAIFFGAGAATYAGVLIWQNRLVASALCGLLGELVNLSVAVPALLAGHGIMALAYGRLAGAVAACLCGGVIARLLPAMIPSAALFRDITAFSWNITLTRLLTAFRTYGATLIIGAFMGPAAVGYYRAAQRVIGAFEDLVSEPVRVLSWSFFRKVPQANASVELMGQAGARFFPPLIYVSAPLFVGIAVMAEDLTLGILGSQWASAVPVLQILAIAALIRSPGTASMPILSLVGKVALLPRYSAIYAVISLICITIGAMNGLIATAISEVVAAVLVFVVSARLMWRHAQLHWPAILNRSWPVLPALLVALFVPVIADRVDLLSALHPLVRFIGLGLAMVALYLPVLMICDRGLWGRLVASEDM